MAQIHQGSNAQIRDNFKEKEFFSGCADAPSPHFLDDATMDAVQAVRTWSGKPVRITSTYRTDLCNQLAGGSTYSQHKLGKAIDFQWIDPTDNAYFVAAFRNEMKCRGPLFNQLRDLGVGGFGFYDTFIHLDSRPGLAAWDYATFDGENINSAFLQGDLPDYCGSFDSDNPTELPSQGSKKKSWVVALLSLFGEGEDKVQANIQPLTYLWITTLVGLAAAIYWTSRR